MGRGVSSGGGQSSLGYLFGSGPEDKPPPPPRQAAPPKDPQNLAPAGISSVVHKAPAVAADGPEKGAPLETGASTLGRNSNNYHRADGQNAGNFITDRPSTKVHAAPGGGSSLGYLFGGGSN